MSQITLNSAYDSLSPVERAFTDKVVRSICVQAERERVRPTDVLARPLNARALGVDGAELLGRPLVQSAVHEQVRAIGSVGAVTIEGMFCELFAIIHSNIQDATVIHEDGWIDWQFDKLTREQMGAFSSVQIEHFADGKRKVKATLWNKIEAMKLAKEMIAELPERSPLRALDPTRAGQSAKLPANVTENDAAEQYARLLQDMGS